MKFSFETEKNIVRIKMENKQIILYTKTEIKQA